MPDAMLDCLVCGTSTRRAVEQHVLEDAGKAGAAGLFCPTCNRNTYWVARHSGGEASPDASGDAAGQAVAESGAAPGAGKPSASDPEHADPYHSYRAERRMGLDRRSRGRRIERRVCLRMPVRLQVNAPGSEFEETAVTENICKNGIYFLTENPYNRGWTAAVALNYDAGDPARASKQEATVVRVDLQSGSRLRGVAMQLH